MSSPASKLSWPLLMTAVFWAYNFVALKLLYEQLSPPATGLLRWVVMYLGLLVVCQLAKVPAWIPLRDAKPVLFQGFLSLGIYMVFFLEGMQRTAAAEGAIVLATAPLFTALFSVLLKREPMRPAVFGWAGVAFLGVCAVILGGGAEIGGHLVGDLMVLISAMVWALSAVLSGPLVHQTSPFTMLTMSMWGGLPVILVYGLVPSLQADWSALTPLSWLAFAHVSVLSGVLAFVGFYVGVRQVGPTGALFYQYLVPGMTVIFAWLTFGTPLAAAQLFGFGLVLLGVVMASRARQKPLGARDLGSALQKELPK